MAPRRSQYLSRAVEITQGFWVRDVAPRVLPPILTGDRAGRSVVALGKSSGSKTHQRYSLSYDTNRPTVALHVMWARYVMSQKRALKAQWLSVVTSSLTFLGLGVRESISM